MVSGLLSHHFSLFRGEDADLLSAGDSWVDLVWLTPCFIFGFSTLKNWKITPKS